MAVPPGARHRADRRRRKLGVFWILLILVGALAAVYLFGGGGFLRLGLSQPSPPQAGPVHGGAAHAPSPSSPAVTPTPGRSASATPSRPAQRRRHPRTTASPSPNPSAGAPSGDVPSGQESAADTQVLALINQARAQAGLGPYTVTAGLDSSSAAHNARMADGCGLSHQCPGEPALGTRETDAGVNWTAAGENIGEGGPVSDTSSAVAQMAVTLTQDMLNEKPPDDGHRLNILSSTFTHIGIAVTIDSSGTVWMTQDFSN
jgi:uncharacterized protein YkwD